MMLSVFFYIAAQNNGREKARGSWFSSVALFSYAVAFSLAYTSLDTGTGALMLFGCVQISMIAWHLVTGNRMHIVEWLGLGVAFTGLIYLVYPAVSTSSFKGLCLMGIAGVAWAIYTRKREIISERTCGYGL